MPISSLNCRRSFSWYGLSKPTTASNFFSGSNLWFGIVAAVVCYVIATVIPSPLLLVVTVDDNFVYGGRRAARETGTGDNMMYCCNTQTALYRYYYCGTVGVLVSILQ